MADNFKGSTKAEWKELIEKSSKGKSYESFSKVFDGIQIEAFHMASDLVHSGATDRQSTAWKIGVRLAAQDPEVLNSSILQFLQLGAEAISFPLDSVDALSTIYKEVHADWIHNDLVLHEKIDPESLTDFFPPNTDFSISPNPKNAKKDLALSIRVDKQNSPASYIGQILSAAQQLDAEGYSLEHIVLHVETHVYLPLEVSFLRALRIVWANYMAAKEIKTYSFKIAAHIFSEEKDKDMQLIEQCVASMNAVMGGADILYLAAPGADANYERLAFQIQNVMKLESKMEQNVDIFAGSYGIENITNTIAEKAWKETISLLS